MNMFQDLVLTIINKVQIKTMHKIYLNDLFDRDDTDVIQSQEN